MRSHCAARPISCRIDGDVVAIDLGGDSRSEMLFLTTAEARGLAGNLEVEGVGMAGDEIIVGIWPWGVEENRSGTVVRSWAKIGV